MGDAWTESSSAGSNWRPAAFSGSSGGCLTTSSAVAGAPSGSPSLGVSDSCACAASITTFATANSIDAAGPLLDRRNQFARRYGRRLPSRPGEFHPEPLTDPDLILSHHPARVTARRLP